MAIWYRPLIRRRRYPRRPWGESFCFDAASPAPAPHLDRWNGFPWYLCFPWCLSLGRCVLAVVGLGRGPAAHVLYWWVWEGERRPTHSQISNRFFLSRSAGPRDARVAGYSPSYIETIPVDERVNKATAMSAGTSTTGSER